MIKPMLNLFRYVALRHLFTKPIRTVLTTLGVAFGIALYVAISIINRSTLASFKESVEAVAGKATLSVAAGESGFPEEKLEIVKKVPGVRHAVPMIESRAYFAGNADSSESLVVLGVDLLQEQAVRTYKTTDEQVIDDPLVFLNQPDSIIITRDFARSHKLDIDSTFELATARGPKRFTVRGMLTPEGPAKAFGGAVAIMDVDGARVTFGKEGKLDRIDIVTREGEDIDSVAAKVGAALGPGYRVERPATQSESLARMVQTFQAMLTLFSTLALLVGLFLITNSVSIAVAERKREIGTLRALGATRLGILVIFLSEAVGMGIVGAFGGAWLGRALASLLVSLIARSMSNQTLTRIDVTQLIFTPGEIVRAVLIGGIAALVAAFWPSARATFIQPLEAMRTREVGEEASKRGFHRAAPLAGLGMLSFMAYTNVSGLAARHTSLDIINQGFGVIGAALVGPAMVTAFIRWFRPIALRLSFRNGATVARLAQDNLLRNPRRTGSNVMSLMVGLLLTVMIGVVNVSFRKTINNWFTRVLRADFIISSAGDTISYQTQPLHEDIGKELEAIPGVRVVEGKGALATRFVHVNYEGQQLGIKAWDEPDSTVHYGLIDVQDRPVEEAGRELYHSPSPSLIVSEPFVMHFNKKTGDSIDLDTPSGRVAFKIVGVAVDFASPTGVLYMDRKVYRKLWNDPLVSAFGVSAAPGTDRATLRAEIDRRLGRARNLAILSNAEMREQLSQTVDKSFAYTRAIEGAALLVGMLGLLNTLLISVMERMRELGMLRAVGMSRKQMSSMILQEALAQGAFGALASAILGTATAYLWITYSLAHVMGWIIHFYMPWATIGTTLLVGTAVALAAGFLPARRASNVEIREALEYE